MAHKGRIVESQIGEQEDMLRNLFGTLINTPRDQFATDLLGTGDNAFTSALQSLSILGRPTGTPAVRVLPRATEQFLGQLSVGKVPPSIMQRFQQGLNRDMAGIRESFGSQGARFGTDLGDVLGRTAGEARVGLEASIVDRARDAAALRSQTDLARRSLQTQTQLGALSQILGLGQRTAGLEFARSEAALNRVVQEYIARLQANPLHKLVENFLAGQE